MLIRILEVGLAVSDLAASGQRLSVVFGARQGPILEAPEFGMRAGMFRVGDVDFELMEPAGPQGLINDFIERWGQGLHHLAFEVADVAAAMSLLRDRGLRLINQEPISSQGCLAAFIHPQSLHGVLLELIEGAAPWTAGEPRSAKRPAASPAGSLDAEGLIGVGVVVPDAAAAAKAYAQAFGAEVSSAPRFKAWLCRAGDVDLFFREAPSPLPGAGRRPGLEHVVMKVKDLARAEEFLNGQEVAFTPGPEALFGGRKSLFIQPTELSGLLVLLVEEDVGRPRH